MMTRRIAVTPETQELVREFSKGLDTTQDEAIQFLLEQIMKPGEDPLLAGHRLRSGKGKAEEDQN